MFTFLKGQKKSITKGGHWLDFLVKNSSKMMTNQHMKFQKKKLFINLTSQSRTKLVLLNQKTATNVAGFIIKPFLIFNFPKL